MHSKSLLIALAATASAEFALHPHHNAVKRGLAARETASATGGSDAGCLTGLVSLYSSLPTPPPELISYETEHPQTDPCSFSVPDSLTSAFSSYETAVSSWANDHMSDISSALSACPAASSYSSLTDLGSCSTGAGKATGTGDINITAATTQSGGDVTGTPGGDNGSNGGNGGNGSSGSGGSSVSKAAAPRETGFVAGAIAAAGFLGAVAAL